MTVSDLVPNHELVKCCLDFAYPVILKVDNISYHRYHKIHMYRGCDDLANTSFVRFPAGTAFELHGQLVVC